MKLVKVTAQVTPSEQDHYSKTVEFVGYFEDRTGRTGQSIKFTKVLLRSTPVEDYVADAVTELWRLYDIKQEEEFMVFKPVHGKFERVVTAPEGDVDPITYTLSAAL